MTATLYLLADRLSLSIEDTGPRARAALRAALVAAAGIAEAVPQGMGPMAGCLTIGYVPGGGDAAALAAEAELGEAGYEVRVVDLRPPATAGARSAAGSR